MYTGTRAHVLIDECVSIRVRVHRRCRSGLMTARLRAALLLYVLVAQLFICCTGRRKGNQLNAASLSPPPASSKGYSFSTGPPPKWAADAVVHKTQFSNTSRAVFVVGFGGTGHHAMQTVFEPCRDAGVCEDASFRESLWNRLKAKDELKRGLFNVKGPGYWSQGNSNKAITAVESMREFAQRASQGNADGKMRIQVVNTLEQRRTGFLSYPNFDKSNVAKTMQPDARLLAEIAEEGEVDIRFVVLLRDPHTAAASVARRFWNGCTKCIYRNGMHSWEQLVKQLRLLDPRFYTCSYLHQLHGFGSSLDELLYPQAVAADGSAHQPPAGGSFQTWTPEKVSKMGVDDKAVDLSDSHNPSESVIKRAFAFQKHLDELCARTPVHSRLFRTADDEVEHRARPDDPFVNRPER